MTLTNEQNTAIWRGAAGVFAVLLAGIIAWGSGQIVDNRQDIARLQDKVARIEDDVAGTDAALERLREKHNAMNTQIQILRNRGK